MIVSLISLRLFVPLPIRPQCWLFCEKSVISNSDPINFRRENLIRWLELLNTEQINSPNSLLFGNPKIKSEDNVKTRFLRFLRGFSKKIKSAWQADHSSSCFFFVIQVMTYSKGRSAQHQVKNWTILTSKKKTIVLKKTRLTVNWYCHSQKKNANHSSQNIYNHHLCNRSIPICPIYQNFLSWCEFAIPTRAFEKLVTVTKLSTSIQAKLLWP